MHKRLHCWWSIFERKCKQSYMYCKMCCHSGVLLVIFKNGNCIMNNIYSLHYTYCYISCHKLNDVIVTTWSNRAKWPSGRYILWPCLLNTKNRLKWIKIFIVSINFDKIVTKLKCSKSTTIDRWIESWWKNCCESCFEVFTYRITKCLYSDVSCFWALKMILY